MYCHNCGNEIFGSYCTSCGAKARSEKSINSGTWQTENSYEKIIGYSEVRNIIAKYANESSSNISAQDFLKLADAFFTPLVSFKTISEIAVPLYQKIGIRIGKSVQSSFNQTIQEVIVKSLCSLAKNGYPLESYDAASNGLVLTAKIPSDMWTWGGIVLSIKKEASFSEVNIAADIKGQLFDWGKCKRVIGSIYTDIENIKI